MTRAHRLAPLTGLAAIACIVAGLATDQAPTSSWPDARIQAWYASHDLAGWFASAYLLALGAPLTLVFAAAVRDRLHRAGASTTACTIVTGSGTALAVTVLTGAGLYAAVPAAMTFTDAPAPPAAISRYLLGAAYGIMVMFSAYAAALLALTVSITALHTRTLPRWLAAAGIPAAALMLANAALPMSIITLWFVVVSIAFTINPTDRSPIPTEPPRRQHIPQPTQATGPDHHQPRITIA